MLAKTARILARQYYDRNPFFLSLTNSDRDSFARKYQVHFQQDAHDLLEKLSRPTLEMLTAGKRSGKGMLIESLPDQKECLKIMYIAMIEEAMKR